MNKGWHWWWTDLFFFAVPAAVLKEYMVEPSLLLLHILTVSVVTDRSLESWTEIDDVQFVHFSKVKDSVWNDVSSVCSLCLGKHKHHLTAWGRVTHQPTYTGGSQQRVWRKCCFSFLNSLNGETQQRCETHWMCWRPPACIFSSLWPGYSHQLTSWCLSISAGSCDHNAGGRCETSSVSLVCRSRQHDAFPLTDLSRLRSVEQFHITHKIGNLEKKKDSKAQQILVQLHRIWYGEIPSPGC